MSANRDEECAMVEEPGPVASYVEMREATLPDGTVMVIAVKPGLSQDEVDLLAAAWQGPTEQ